MDTEFLRTLDPQLLLGVFIALVAVVAGAAYYLSSSKKRRGCLDPEKFKEFKLVKKQQLSHNVAKFVFELPTPTSFLGLPIGQHISCRGKEAQGEEVIKPYTPTTLDSDLGRFELVIKMYPQGRMSHHFREMRVGDHLGVKGPKGRFKYQPGQFRAFGMLAGGSGITPMFQVARAILENPTDKTKVHLIYANVTYDDILLKEELESLTANYPDQFKIYYVLNQPPEVWDGGVGFVTKEMIQAHCPAPASDIQCSGLNFARNVKCFQCDEARPKRQLTGSEWECPQCDFYNYGRNIACLRCDCKRPRDFSLNSANSAKDPELERRMVENEEKAQRWFSKVAQGGADANSVDTDGDFPEIMPLRKGVNRFVVNTRKTPLERRLADAETDGTKTNKSLNEILGSTSSLASSRRFESSQVVNSDFVPFVPLPPDMFAKKPDKEETLTSNNQIDGVSDKSSPSPFGQETDEPEKDEKESEEKPARWLKRITELHNVSDLESEIQEETSPEKMPMRKGENQFVVSRKKDRSLTPPANKRRISIETKDSDFVPFVPFPPNYFTKHKQPEETTTTATDTIPVPVQEKPREPSSNNQEPTAGKMRNGKSLEGSLVKEPDFLDMSEEAKAERWFKRVAEIKNISELSRIPDEDFPSIMPMRKGVNRFVVSKRKTPLERRLASQRQQRNPPPITDSDTTRNGGDS